MPPPVTQVVLGVSAGSSSPQSILGSSGETRSVPRLRSGDFRDGESCGCLENKSRVRLDCGDSITGDKLNYAGSCCRNRRDPDRNGIAVSLAGA